MKTTMRSTLSALLCVLCLFGFAACASNEAPVEGLWSTALFTEDAELGSGTKTQTVAVEAGDTTVTFIVHTDKDTVGDALLEHDLIAGDESDYGLYVKAVNGITADYDVDQSYWAFYIGDEYAMTGVDATAVEEGVAYRLVYTK